MKVVVLAALIAVSFAQQLEECSSGKKFVLTPLIYFTRKKGLYFSVSTSVKIVFCACLFILRHSRGNMFIVFLFRTIKSLSIKTRV